MPASGYIADTFVAGEQPTTSKWNELWGNDASFNNGNGFNDSIIISRHLAAGISVADKALNPYKASVYLNTATGFPASAAFVKVPLDTREYDTGSNFDITTNHRFTAPIAGFYHFSGAVMVSGPTAGEHYTATLYKNGAEIKRGQEMSVPTTGVNYVFPVSADIQLAINDYVELWAYGGNSRGFGNNNYGTYLAASLSSAS